MAEQTPDNGQAAPIPPEDDGASKWMLVLLRTDSGGSCSVLCKGIEQDPLFPDKRMLQNVFAMYWPFGSVHLHVLHWSVPADTVLNWMMGVVNPGVPLTPAAIAGEPKTVPLLPDTTPNAPLASPSEMAVLAALLENKGKGKAKAAPPAGAEAKPAEAKPPEAKPPEAKPPEVEPAAKPPAKPPGNRRTRRAKK